MRWLIILILCRLGWRLNNTKLGTSLRIGPEELCVQGNILSIPQMSFNDPTVFEEHIRSFVVTQIYAFAGIAHNVSSTRVGRWTITNKLLKMSDVMWCRR